MVELDELKVLRLSTPKAVRKTISRIAGCILREPADDLQTTKFRLLLDFLKLTVAAHKLESDSSIEAEVKLLRKDIQALKERGKV